MKRRISLLFMVFILAGTLFLTGCGDEGGKGKKADEIKEYGVGEVAKTETFEISIVKISKPTEWIHAPKADEEYVAVEISAKNISKEEAGVGSGDFEYVDEEEGKMRGYYRNTFVGFNVRPDTFGGVHLKPGETFNGTIVYLMPKSLNNVTMWYRRGMTMEPDAIFKFTK